MKRISEFELIERLSRKIPKKLQGHIGIGDDAGVFEVCGKTARLISTDTIVDGVDFILSKAKPEWIGRKALAVNLSDMAAMGAKPQSFVVTLGVPSQMNFKNLEWIYAGMMELAAEYNVSCVGGDMTGAKQFFISISLTGTARHDRIVKRCGARPGDFLAVTGSLGGSILKKHFLFRPRIREGFFLAQNQYAHAMIDLSDGLLQDLGHILKQSHAGCELELHEIPVSKDALKKAGQKRSKALEYALTDGEDFELLLSVPERKVKVLSERWRRQFPGVRLTWIGRITQGSPLIRVKNNQGQWRVLRHAKKGFQHF